MKTHYCWRCRCDIPMIEEHEWEILGASLTDHIHKIKRIRQEKSCDLATARRLAEQQACDLYFDLTGYRETNFNPLWHHRLADYGPECPKCGHLFRTPRTRFCANCGFKREDLPNKALHPTK
jgi:ribosomal protein L32